MKFKKGISAIIATSLFIVISIITIISFQTWFNNYSSYIYSDVEQTNWSISANQITNVVTGELYFNGKNKSNIQDILVEGKSCNISLNVSGIKDISIKNCLGNISTQTPEITVILDKGIISKKIYLPDIKVIESVSEFPEVSFSPNEFVSYWNTSANSSGSSANNQIKLPLYNGGSYNFIVDWGDGNIDTITSYNQAEVTHTYVKEGVYLIKISGEIIGFRFNNIGDKLKIRNILNWGDLHLGNDGNYFSGCSNVNFIGNDNLNLTGTTNLYETFKDASSFNGNIAEWNVSKIINMGYMFYGASNFNQNLSDWDVSYVTNMNCMFRDASNFNGNISSWNVSKVTNMYAMFCFAVKFNQDLSNWDVNNETYYTNFDLAAYLWDDSNKPVFN